MNHTTNQITSSRNPVGRILRQIYYSRLARILLLPGCGLAGWWITNEWKTTTSQGDTLSLWVVLTQIGLLAFGAWWWLASLADHHKYSFRNPWGTKRQILQACARGDLTALQKLANRHQGKSWAFTCQGRFDDHERDYAKLTPLLVAIKNYHWQVVKWLLMEHGLIFSSEFLGVTNELKNKKFLRSFLSKEQQAVLEAASLELTPSFGGWYRWLDNAPCGLLRPENTWEMFLAEAPVELVAEIVQQAYSGIKPNLQALFVAMTLTKYAQFGNKTEVDDLIELILPRINPEEVMREIQNFVDKIEAGEEAIDWWRGIKTQLQKQVLAGVIDERGKIALKRLRL